MPKLREAGREKSWRCVGGSHGGFACDLSRGAGARFCRDLRIDGDRELERDDHVDELQ